MVDPALLGRSLRFLGLSWGQFCYQLDTVCSVSQHQGPLPDSARLVSSKADAVNPRDVRGQISLA